MDYRLNDGVLRTKLMRRRTAEFVQELTYNLHQKLMSQLFTENRLDAKCDGSAGCDRLFWVGCSPS